MEEVLTGELVEEVGQFASRVRELLSEFVLDPADGDALPDAEEIAATAWRTLQLSEIAALRTRLVPEWPVYGLVANGGGPKALAGRIDAIAYEIDRAEVVIDWKSDVDPNETDMRFHAGQLEDYLRATGAARGALVYMTRGFVPGWEFHPAHDDGKKHAAKGEMRVAQLAQLRRAELLSLQGTFKVPDMKSFTHDE